MKSQLASVFMIAVVACGGRGGDGAPLPVEGMTDVPQTDARAAGNDPVDTPRTTQAPVPLDDNIAAPQAIEDPIPLQTRGARARPTEDLVPVPVAGTASAQPSADEWQARAPERYVIRTCGYGAAPPACTVEVADEGRLVSRANRSWPDEPWASAPIDDGNEPVASLFDEARRPIEGCTTSFELDPVYAYPSQIYFDCKEEGWGVRVSCFEPDTLDSSRCE
jgi:hypothetical protein